MTWQKTETKKQKSARAPVCFLLSVFSFLLAAALPLSATTVTGTIQLPDGTPVTGTLEFILSQRATTLTPPAIFVPERTTCTITSGAIDAGCTVQGNDTLSPAGTFYRVRILDLNNRALGPQVNYTITGASVDLGSLPITATDTLVPPDGTVAGNLQVTGDLNASTVTLSGQTSDPAGLSTGALFHRSDLNTLRFNVSGLEVFDGTQFLPLTSVAGQTFEFGGNIRIPNNFSALFKRMNEIRLVEPFLWTETGVPAKIDAALSDCAGAQCLVVFPSNLGAGEPTSLPDNTLTLDLRRTGGYRFTGAQDPGTRKGLALRGLFTQAPAASEIWQPFQVHLTAQTGGINNSGGPKIQYSSGLFSLAKRTRGQASAVLAEIGGFSQGDTIAVTGVAHCYGGINAGGDEGCAGLRGAARQGDLIFAATAGTATYDAVNDETALPYTAPANDAYRGERRPVINLTTAVTAPGTVTSISGTPPVVSGSATTFCASLGVTCPFTPAAGQETVFFSMASDDGSGGEKLVVPVQSIASNTSLTLAYNVQGSAKPWAGATAGAYRLYRGGLAKRVETNQMVLEGNVASLFATGNSIEQPLGFDFLLSGGLRLDVSQLLPSAIGGAGLALTNTDTRSVRNAIAVGGPWERGLEFAGTWSGAGTTTGILFQNPPAVGVEFNGAPAGAFLRLDDAAGASTGSFDFFWDETGERFDLSHSANIGNQFNFFPVSGLAIGTDWRARTRFETDPGGYFLLDNSGTVPASGLLRAGSTTVGTPLLTTRNSANTSNVNLLTYSAADALELAQAGTTTRTAGPLEVGAGVAADGAGLKHARVSTGSVAAAGSAAVTVTWTTAFADANYTATCSVADAAASTSALRIHHMESVAAASLTVRVANDDSAAAHTGTVHCVAIHD